MKNFQRIKMSEKILLSTDIGSDIDDALSLLAILNSGINLKAIYTTNGDVASRAYIAKYMIDLARRRDIEVATGESKPLGGDVTPYSHYEDAHVPREYEIEVERDVKFKPLETIGVNTKGSRSLEKRLSKDEHTIFSLAPLTNIAKVIRENPSLAKKVKRLFVMGCRFTETNDVPEHNIRYDVPSADIVFSSEIPITVIPGDLCSKYRMSTEFLNQIKTPAGEYVKKMTEGFIASNTSENFRVNGMNQLIKDRVKGIIGKRSIEEHKRLSTITKRLIENVDDDWGATFDSQAYFEEYNLLIKYLEMSEFHELQPLANILRMAIPKDLSVADVYVPYCFLNYDKLKTQRGNIIFNEWGVSYLGKGDKHEIVTDLDFDDFRNFLSTNLR